MADTSPPRPQALPTRASLRLLQKPPEKGLLGYLATAMSAVVFIAVLAVAVLVIVAPLLVHGQPLTVLTNSMSPHLPPGTLVVNKPTAISDIRVGDIVTYQVRSGEAAVVSHRVVERVVNLEGDTTFITQGDNNDAPDPAPVTAIQIKGTLWYAIPYLGWINSVLNGETRSVISIPLAAALLGYAAFTVVAALRHRHRSQRRSAPSDRPVETGAQRLDETCA
jgi:signal peptidase